MRLLQTMMPPAPRAPQEPLLLVNVSPGLLLPPAGRGLVSRSFDSGRARLWSLVHGNNHGHSAGCLANCVEFPVSSAGVAITCRSTQQASASCLQFRA